MPAYNFKARWVHAVETGRKPITIRARRKDRRDPRVGQIAHCFFLLRQKGCRLLRRSPIIEVDEITIRAKGPSRVKVNVAGVWLNDDQLNALTKLDGHDSPIHFRAFFEGEHGLPFRGFLIRWDPAIHLEKEAV